MFVIKYSGGGGVGLGVWNLHHEPSATVLYNTHTLKGKVGDIDPTPSENVRTKTIFINNQKM